MTKPLVSYAQNREDLYLWALLGHRKNGFYVDVGAHHPEFHSVTKLFYDRGWRGINLEPNPLLYKTFSKARRRDINLNLGAANKKGSLQFRNYPHHNGLSTFSKPIMRLHEQEKLPYEDLKVYVRPLSEILSDYDIPHIDFMKIDVEGFEPEVIAGNDWKKYRPSVLAIEATVRNEIGPALKRLGYELEFFDGLNNYYIDKNSDESLTIYNYAPRILSYGWYTSLETKLEAKIADLEARLVEKEKNVELLANELNSAYRLKNQPRNFIVASTRVAKRYGSKLAKSGSTEPET